MAQATDNNVVVVAPSGATQYRFVALEDSFEPSVSTHYAEGQTYSVRAGNAKLHALAKKWIEENKIKVVAA